MLRNSGSKTPGIDGKTRKDYTTDEQKQQLRQQVKQIFRKHISSPVRRIFIPKPHKPNEQRPLGIPNIEDRVAQDVVRSILEPIYESKQHAHSYGFRPFRCTHHAIERIRWLIGQHHYHWAVEIDIKGFFDNVDHETMINLLERDIHDRKLLKVVRSMLGAGLVYKGEFQETDLGTPQGGLASPLLGNIYLTELDRYIADMYENLGQRERTKAAIPCFIIRYADDAVILCKSRGHAEEIKHKVDSFLRETLKLTLSVEKTLITHVNDGIDFLGFHIKRWMRQGIYRVLVKPSQKAITKFKRMMSRESKAILSLPGTVAIALLNSKIRGFAEYFRRGNAKEVFGILDYYLWWLVLRRLTQLTRKSKRTVTRKYLYPYNLDANHPQYRKYAASNFGFPDADTGGVYMLDKLSYYKIEYPNKCSQKHPYIKEDRVWLEGARKLNDLIKAQKKRFLQRLFGGDNWFSFRSDIAKRQHGRCAQCSCQLTKNTHVYYRDSNSYLNHPEEEWNDFLIALCMSCYKQKRT